MPFRRFSRRSLNPVNSIKHVIDTNGTLVQAGTVVSVSFIVAVPNVDTTTFKPGDVRVGAKVNGVFFSIFNIGQSGAPVNFPIDWFIIKLHEGQTAPVPGQTGTSKLRNQIIHEEKGLVGSGDGTAMAFKGVIAIPRGMRRMREGDSFEFHSRVGGGGTSDVTFCFKAIYKSFF